MSDVPEMVERVEGAILSAMSRGGDSEAMARAAIEAMREPTEAMLKAGARRFSDCWSLEPGEGLDEEPEQPIWQAMIDAALTSPPHPTQSGADPRTAPDAQ